MKFPILTILLLLAAAVFEKAQGEAPESPQLYFIASPGNIIYRVGADGSDLTELIDLQELGPGAHSPLSGIAVTPMV